MEGEESWVVGNGVLLDINGGEALAQPAQLSSVEEKINRKYRMGHVTYLCI